MVVFSVVVGIVMIDVVIVVVVIVVVVVEAPYETNSLHSNTTKTARCMQWYGVDPTLIRRDTRLLFDIMAYQAG